MFTPEMLKEWEEERKQREAKEPEPSSPATAPEVYYQRGEGGPDDQGSKGRYAERRHVVPPLRLLPYWVLHNVVARPLIGLAPIKPFFDFHDWTAKKIGSEVLMKSL